MLEMPELITITKQLNDTIANKKVLSVLPPSKQHKFCWFNGDPNNYDTQLKEAKIVNTECFGIFAEIIFDNGKRLCINDGIHPQYFADSKNAPSNYQCTIIFDDHSALAFTVGMYGGIYLHNGDYDNEYYQSSRKALSPFDKNFTAYFETLIKNAKPTLSAKALLATEQRIPGIGNGVVQDILYAANINPKRKINTLTNEDILTLKKSITTVLQEMITNGGRDTEKDIFGNPGSYKTKLSRNTQDKSCTKCGTHIIKETFLGGTIYYCPTCQKL